MIDTTKNHGWEANYSLKHSLSPSSWTKSYTYEWQQNRSILITCGYNLTMSAFYTVIRYWHLW